MRGSRYLLNSLINCHGPQFVSLGLLILPSHLSGLVIKYLFGLQEKLSFQSFWLLSLKKADLGAVFLALGRI